MHVWSEISYIYYFLPGFTVSCMKLVIFLLYNNIFIAIFKYCAHSYTVDVVFTLSCGMYSMMSGVLHICALH